MADQEEQAEPSMEDILASIRKILSEDEEGGDGEALEAAEDDAPADDPPAAESPAEPEAPAEDEVASQDDIDALFDAPSEPEPEPEPEPEDDEPVVFEEDDPEPEEGDVLELTDDMVTEEPAPAPAAAAVAPPPSAALQAIADGESYGLVAPPVETEAAKKVSELTAALMAERGVRLGNVGTTLEELVRALLKPMIKEWLDENLPFMTERIVQAEIQRIVHKGERAQD